MASPALPLLSAVAAVGLAAASGGCAPADRWGSECTEVPVRVLDTREQRLPTAGGDPILVREHDGTRIEIDFGVADASLVRRMKDVPMTQDPATALRERLRRAVAGSEAVHSAEILKGNESLPQPERRARVLESHEAHALMTRALRDGTARVLVDGHAIDRVDVEYYEADDEVGKTNGVRFIGGGRKVLDYCSTDPAENAT
jgi:hypothetical protein